MSNRKPLMPKATAVWLVENTSLSFDQIAEFCGLHHLEVKGIADGDVAQGIKGMDPIASGQLSREEIKRGAIALRAFWIASASAPIGGGPCGSTRKGWCSASASRRRSSTIRRS